MNAICIVQSDPTGSTPKRRIQFLARYVSRGKNVRHESSFAFLATTWESALAIAVENEDELRKLRELTLVA